LKTEPVHDIELALFFTSDIKTGMKALLEDKWTIQSPHFTKEQTLILKGVGILLIVLHNFFHNLTPIIGENEFSFQAQTSWRFYQTVQSHPAELLRATFTYFGHYGVQIFIFFSAYGLTRKYNKEPLVFGDFFKGRLFKIYLSFLLCLSIYILLGLVKAAFMSDEKVFYWNSLLWKALLISNFIPRQALMPVGPWWFLPFIFQFYLFYPLFLKLFQKFRVKFLILTGIAFICLERLINPFLIANDMNINYMIFGHVPVVCLGVYIGARESIKIPAIYVVLSFALFAMAIVNSYAWLISDLTFTVLILIVFIAAFNSRLQQSAMVALLIFFGDLSFHLFMVNGFLRTPFHSFAETYNVWWIDNLTALASLFFSTLFAFILSRIDRRLRLIFHS
jgi:peptidoglycan/LPS O-acetylase OafA/YrhL